MGVVQILQKTYITSSDGTKTKLAENIDLYPCKKEYWSKLENFTYWSQQFDSQNFSDWLCPKPGFTIKIGGLYSNDYFYHLKVSVYPCEQNYYTSYSDYQCQSKEAVLEFQAEEKLRFSFYFVNHIVNPQKPHGYIKQYLYSDVFFNLQPYSTYRTADIFLQNINVETDSSLSLIHI
eukprot:TRINITY_DN19060_c0_g1_i2.p2 TRINITY_DN19060_c0_g1~~TRINITY_DN19060_c0_g1_i2.p2  ORF type:complete len:177 (-),score=25.59 TRINITY_DN19060_c0_g1_i2:73-603(-)